MDTTNWQAQWIWGEPGESPQYLYFRRDFELPANAVKATLRITADSRYRVWVGNYLVGNGPIRCTPPYLSNEEYDITKNIRDKKLLVAVLVAHYGVGTAYSCKGAPGLLAQIDAELEDGSSFTLGTDADWKVFPAPYETGYKRISDMLAYPEVFDFRREPMDWSSLKFDDSAWQNAKVIGSMGMEPWTHLVPRDIPLRESNIYFWFDKFTAFATVDAYEPDLLPRRTPAEDMERATRLEFAPVDIIQELPDLVFRVMPQSGENGISLVMDFEREVCGYLHLVVLKSGSGRIDIGYSERIEADGSVNPNRWGGSQVHYADRVFLREGRQEIDIFTVRTFRYLRLDFYDNPEPVEIAAAMVESRYPAEQRGKFECSDALLNKIWEVGRDTLALCMDDAFMNSPWRDRGQSAGNLDIALRGAAYAFGDTLLARRALSQFALAVDADGWFPQFCPGEPPQNPIVPTFCFTYSGAVWQYFLLSGNRKLLEEVWPAIDRLTKTIEKVRDDDGLLSNLPGESFIDYADLETRGQSTAVNAFAVGCLRNAARIARAIGIPGRGGDLEFVASEIAEAVNDLLYDRERGVYMDGIVEGVRSKAFSEHANFLCALYGVADAQQTESILESAVRSRGSGAIRTTSPYFMFYSLELLYAKDRPADASSYFTIKWGRMLQQGATTFWELWQPTLSLCHIASTSPVYFLMAEVAGIQPTQPGWEEFNLHLLPGLLTWLRTTVPTPKGNITLAYHYRTGRAETLPDGQPVPFNNTQPTVAVNFTVPTGTLADVRIPLPEHIISSDVRVNGKTVWEQGRPLPGASKYQSDRGALRFSAGPGTYHVEMERGSLPADNEIQE